jgi:hypothetical protein
VTRAPRDASWRIRRLEAVMMEFGRALWVHGHRQHAVDYEVGRTRVVSNPRGYEGEG